MSLRINSNDSAMNAHRNLAASSAKMGQQIERLSSGYKINRGSDDPAGLVVSENLRAQIGGLGQAISNSQNAVNMIKTAEGALTEVNSLLRSMRDLAVHAANTGANSNEAIAADQAQIKSALESLDRISANTAFGDKKLLNGSAGLKASVVDPSNVASINASQSGSSVLKAGGAVNVNVTQVATRASSDSATLTGGKALADGTLSINGVFIGEYTTATDASSIATDINSKSAQTGVVANFDADTNTMTLTQLQYGSAGKIEVGGTAAVLGAQTATAGLDVAATVTVDGAAQTFTGAGWNLNSAAGDTIQLRESANGNLGHVATVSGGVLNFQIGAKAGETAAVAISSTATKDLGTGVDSTYSSLASIDVTKDAETAIKVLDAAIAQVSKQRADLGAFQKNVLESNINSLGIAKENVAASESSIRDADMAAEMVEFTKYQILNQAGTAMLTQANQAPQQLLSLLR